MLCFDDSPKLKVKQAIKRKRGHLWCLQRFLKVFFKGFYRLDFPMVNDWNLIDDYRWLDRLFFCCRWNGDLWRSNIVESGWPSIGFRRFLDSTGVATSFVERLNRRLTKQSRNNGVAAGVSLFGFLFHKKKPKKNNENLHFVFVVFVSWRFFCVSYFEKKKTVAVDWFSMTSRRALPVLPLRAANSVA